MFSVAQPTTQLNATEQDTLVKQIGLALLRAAPRDWRKVSAEYRAVGRYHELTGEIVLEDGSTQEWIATHDIATLFGRLRAGMYRDGRGTWFNARYQLDHPSSYNLEYNRDEPQWHLAPPPQAYSDELRMFPRTEENVPEWLIRRMSGLGPEQPGPHFRIARIFDTIGPAGRPVINRPDLDVDEQDRLLDYLDHAPVVVQDRGYDIDRLAQAPEATVPVAFHSDGHWIWPAAVNFYLRTYGVSPEADLIEHIRANGFQLPQVDELTLQGAAAYLTRGSQTPQQRPAPGGPGGPGAGGAGAGGPGGPGAAGGPGAGGPGAGGPGAAGPGGPGGPAAGGPGAGGPGGPGTGGPGGPGAAGGPGGPGGPGNAGAAGGPNGPNGPGNAGGPGGASGPGGPGGAGGFDANGPGSGPGAEAPAAPGTGAAGVGAAAAGLGAAGLGAAALGGSGGPSNPDNFHPADDFGGPGTADGPGANGFDSPDEFGTPGSRRPDATGAPGPDRRGPAAEFDNHAPGRPGPAAEFDNRDPSRPAAADGFDHRDPSRPGPADEFDHRDPGRPGTAGRPDGPDNFHPADDFGGPGTTDEPGFDDRGSDEHFEPAGPARGGADRRDRPAPGSAAPSGPQGTRVSAPVSGPDSPGGSHGLGTAAAAVGAAGVAGAAGAAASGTHAESGHPHEDGYAEHPDAAGYAEPGHHDADGYDQQGHPDAAYDQHGQAGYDQPDHADGYDQRDHVEHYDQHDEGYEEPGHVGYDESAPHDARGYDAEPYDDQHGYEDAASHEAGAYAEPHGYDEAGQHGHDETGYDESAHHVDDRAREAAGYDDARVYDDHLDAHGSNIPGVGTFEQPAAPGAQNGLVGADGVIGADGLIGADDSADEPAPNRHTAEPEAGRRSAPDDARPGDQEGGRRRAQPDAEADDSRRDDVRLNAEDGGRRGTEPDSPAEPADEHGSHVGAAAAGVAAAGGLAAAGLAAAHGRSREKEAESRHGAAPERAAEPPFEQDFDGAQYDRYDDEDHTDVHHDLLPGRNGAGPGHPADDEDDTDVHQPVDDGHEEPVLFTHGNEPSRDDDEQQRAELFTHSGGYEDDNRREPEYDAGPPTAMIMPGSEIPGGLPVPEMPVAPTSGGRRAAREQAEPAPVARREQPAQPELAELQAKLDELNVPEAAYRLGGPTERGWSVEQVGEGWRVGWYDGELINPAVFGDAEDAAAFMLGKVLLHPDGYVAAEAPVPAAQPVADAPKPPVVATLSPEVATGSFPVRPRENVPPQEQTAFTPADQLLADDEPPAPPVRQTPPPPPPTQVAAPVSPPTQVAPPVSAPPTQVASPVSAPPTQVAPPVGPPPRREPPVRREEPVRANGTGGSGQWPIAPLSGEPPLTLFRGKELRELPAGSELDRFGGPNGNLTYAAGTPFEERSLVPEWVNRPYHVYRVQRPLETLAGVAIPWFNQPGGGSAYLLPASIEELLAEGDLIELDPGEPPID
ncbi:glycohydrolase toxin TNT-related protein [Amycolatopsis sp. GA6-003]|uniref:glycohydrolase toxin TNT-related protein n=1 Tax=Amycolatopsis sp. GA6-003 TaxID=2652444 RepID=UPI0039174FE2